jgi:cytoskeletal protein RodZ
MEELQSSAEEQQRGEDNAEQGEGQQLEEDNVEPAGEAAEPGEHKAAEEDTVEEDSRVVEDIQMALVVDSWKEVEGRMKVEVDSGMAEVDHKTAGVDSRMVVFGRMDRRELVEDNLAQEAGHKRTAVGGSRQVGYVLRYE